MENKEIKYYTGSDGVAKDISLMETTHLSNSIAKKMREVFESTNKDDFNNRIKVINDLKEEMFARFNIFYDTLDKGE